MRLEVVRRIDFSNKDGTNSKNVGGHRILRRIAILDILNTVRVFIEPGSSIR